MNTPVSFQMAELLKEKGFDKPLPSICYIKEEYNYTSTMVYEVLDMNFEYILRPTIAEVVMWLYEKHGIWIGVYDLDDTTIFRHCFSNIDFNSPTEAYSSAIEYTLNNLI